MDALSAIDISWTVESGGEDNRGTFRSPMMNVRQSAKSVAYYYSGGNSGVPESSSGRNDNKFVYVNNDHSGANSAGLFHRTP